MIDPTETLKEAAALAGHLERMGVMFLPRSSGEAVDRISSQMAMSPSVATESSAQPAAPPPIRPPAKPLVPTPPATTPTAKPIDAAHAGYADEPMLPDQRAGALATLQEKVSGCTACEILSSCRNTTVFGEGNPSARFVFMGEGPGADEDRTGRPFVGAAGKLLTKMIEACTLHREDTYILNTVKCRPPANRNPEPDEIANCRAFYQRQLEIIQPEYIVCLGRVAAQELLQSKLSIGRMRGKWHAYSASKVLVTYHPAYLLRNQDAKKATWEDLKMMLADAGIRLP